jgi:hypothetical protein
MWNPADPGASVALSSYAYGRVWALAVLPDGRLASAGDNGGCWCGTRRTRGPGRSSSAATRSGRCWCWRCCPTGGWPAAGRTECWCGICRTARLAVLSHVPRTRSLPRPPHPVPIFSSVMQAAEFHVGRCTQQHRICPEPGSAQGKPDATTVSLFHPALASRTCKTWIALAS